jgi:hypothetical protein
MDFATLDTLRHQHPAWRLLVADHAPLIASFLHRSFLEANARALPQRELVLRLEDHLHTLRERLGEESFPRTAAAYLDDWAADGRGWLRKFYPPDTDEPHFDLTSAAERAIRWLSQLADRSFVGTESRLRTVFHLLEQMTEGSELDPEARLAELERRKAEIEAEMARVRTGHVELLETVLGEHDAISGSDPGRSFRAFWNFLMSPTRQEELSRKLERVFALPAVQALKPDPRLLRIHFDWLETGEHTQRTVARLSEQLRRYLDDRAFLENRRIMQLLRGVEQHALAVRNQPPPGRAFMQIDEPSPSVELPLERPLFSPPVRLRMADAEVLEASEDVPAEALFSQAFIDKERLRESIRHALQTRAQVSLAELLHEAPLQQGLAELVAYLDLAADDRTALFEDSRTQTLTWTDARGRARRITLPLVLFHR